MCVFPKGAMTILFEFKNKQKIILLKKKIIVMAHFPLPFARTTLKK